MPTQFSYEFFPPRTSRMTHRLWRATGQLERLSPQFFSMTFGALGSTRQISIDTVLAMHEESPIPVAAHLTCVEATRAEVDQIARKLSHAGINRLVALRGDSDSTSTPKNAYQNAEEFVSGLLEIAEFDISVAAYPEVHPRASSAMQDLLNLKAKLDAGANRAITQYFFDAETFLRFRDRAEKNGINKPIVPGILPIHDFEKLQAFNQRCGATLPSTYSGLFAKVKQNRSAQYRLSLDLAVDLCENLAREGVEQFHFYTLNQTDMCFDISLALGANVSSLKTASAA